MWLGDVGWNDYEEINRIADPTSSPVANLGWPCFEGNGQQSAFAAAGLDSCASLYQTPTGLLSPYFAYAHSATVVPGETCPTGSSAIAGMAFYQGGPYPAAYDGTLFFADHSRNCIWAMHQGSNGLPDPTQVETFVAGAANPVDLETGPNGDLFYVDFDGGTIHRVVFGGSNLAPTAVIKATPSSGPSPLTVALRRDGFDRPGGSCADLLVGSRQRRGVRRFDIGHADRDVRRHPGRTRSGCRSPTRRLRPARRPSMCSSTIPCRTPSSTRRPRR